MVYYINPVNEGIISCNSNGDGYTVTLKWNIAYPTVRTNKMAYHIYMSTDESTVFSEGVKFVSVGTATTTDIFDLDPGEIYHWAVRGIEYNEDLFDLTTLPETFSNLKVYPSSILRANITETATLITLLDSSEFPATGTVRIGVELVNYTSNDLLNNDLVLTSALLQRGYNSTTATYHNTDGYDGYETWSPFVTFTLGREEMNTRVFSVQSRFDLDAFSYTIPDGYHQITQDILTTDLSGSDASNVGFPSYDYAGWHRTNPADLFSGACVGSYFGGQQGCADGFNVRGLSIQEQNNQRQELLLNITAEPVCLIRKRWTGITCSCYIPSTEYADDRCPKCLGTKFIIGWDQYFNPRSTDGRIMVRFSPADDDVKTYEAGLESEFITECWTLTVPTVKDRDIIVRFDQDGNEEFRYEILSVNRNKTLMGLQGAQKFKVQRIRKTDPAYQIAVFRDTSTLPAKLNTAIGSASNIAPHVHEIVTSNQSPANFGQITSTVQGHSHQVTWRNGQLVVLEALGHTHDIIL